MNTELTRQVIETLMEIMPLLKENLLQPKGQGEYKELSRSHSPILFMLGRHGAMPMSELARRLRSSKPHITMLIDKLENDGLVLRKASEQDRRVTEVLLTQKGDQMLKSLLGSIKENIFQRLSSLGENELSFFFTSLAGVKSVLSKIDQENK